ncbi:SAF domain-containing protein [Arsenicicoccus dermatophilus]|uniref:SAF domain-containing protein n=1 Tax=Arsenicicoccus dermatophilus TaxID=1076331 RepID=UPI00391755C5
MAAHPTLVDPLVLGPAPASARGPAGPAAGPPAPARVGWRERLAARGGTRRWWWLRLGRRVLGALLAAAAVALTVRLAFPPPAPVGVLVPTAARDLPAGHRLTAADLTVRRWPGPDAPSRPASVASLAGRPLVVAVRAGDPLPAAAVVGPALVDGLADGRVALSIPDVPPLVAQAASAGDRVQLWAGERLVSWDAVVLARGEDAGGGGPVPAPALGPGSGSTGDGGTGGTLLVSLTRTDVERVQAARGGSPDPRPIVVVLRSR